MVLENRLFFKFFAWGVGVNEYPRDISSELEIHIGMDGSVRVNYWVIGYVQFICDLVFCEWDA